MKQKVYDVVDPKCGAFFKATTWMTTPVWYQHLLPMAITDQFGVMQLVHEPKFVICSHCGSLVLMDKHYGTLLKEGFYEAGTV